MQELCIDYNNKPKNELEESSLHNALFKCNSKRTIAKTHEESESNVLQAFVKILSLELDKLGKLASGSNAHSIADINRTIARMMLGITKDETCRECLEAFKLKLNSVLAELKHSLEEQCKKQLEQETSRSGSKDSPFIFTESECESNILTKITPVMNGKGKYMVDIEKVVSDLLLIRDALYSVFQQAGEGTARALEGTSCTILEELTKAKETMKASSINNVAKHYRVLLNTILRFAVEATWVINGGLKKKHSDSNEELLRLKLLNAELNEKLAENKATLPRNRKYL
eukprot:TRINITY_DN9381_c0_g3_i1.p1 TRINITY_DN9381_c0_g3~~TRINITY_DN9381_c0_g3_i1.p1  ORF type:complete len:286 (-),score=107.59 TRINITY_DN9381_c0_g3_i1:73-930(-)